jgi:imidazolonepropionase-like amidohydrolase
MISSFLLSIPLFVSGTSVASSQQRPDAPANWETTDDPRRVPIPPVDRSRQPVLVLRGGTLIDGTGAAPVANAVVVMQGDRILDAGSSSRVQPPAGARVVSVEGLYVVPGLIDLHLHFTQQRGDDFGRYRDSDAASAIRGMLLIDQLLDGGITAVRDMGTRNDLALKLKEAVERRMIQGPRIFWSGQLIASRGGHGDETTSTATGRPRAADEARVRIATGPDDWRLAVREQIRNGADWIKITAPYSREEVAAAVAEAHLHGIKVAADAFGEFVDMGAEAGLDSLEHPLDVSDAGIALMKKHGTSFVPTMTAFYNVIHTGYPPAGIPPGGFYFTMSRRFPVTHDGIMSVLSRARAAGLLVGIGTDIPFENEKRYPSDYFVELRLFKEAGYTDAEILYAATRDGGKILGIEDKLGTIEKGKLADVLVVSGNPLEDYRNLENLRLLVADGEIVRDRTGRGPATSGSGR